MDRRRTTPRKARMPVKKACPSFIAIQIEALESRTLLSTTLPANINLSKLRANESEGAISVDPSNPQHVFALSNIEHGDGLFAGISSDGGATWSTRTIATDHDSLVAACCDPSAAFDTFGNLFIAYVNSNTDAVQVIRSTNGGSTFARVITFRGDIDQPTVTVGTGSVWVTFERDNKIYASGAAVSGLGSIGVFSVSQVLPGSKGGNFGDIAVGPLGQVLVTYELPSDGSGPAKIYTNLDADGLGPTGFGSARLATFTKVGGFLAIPAQSAGEIDAEPGLTYDRSGGTFSGRVYLVYTDASRANRTDTNIMMRFSSDNGSTWSAATRVNRDKSGNSQFLPRIALDQTTGNVAFSWHDSRKDNGSGSGSTNTKKNDDAQLWGAAARPNSGGLVFSTNFQISAGTSNAADANNDIDYGDYTGLSFDHGNFFPIWADNSNSTADNPNGRLHKFDIYTAKIAMPVIP